MPIYTRTGDTGMTSLFGGKRVSKSDDVIDTYGTIDELTSFVGLSIVKITAEADRRLLIKIQRSLYQIMARLSGAKVDLSHLDKEILEFEKEMDKIGSSLPRLNKFIVPGGTETSSLLHICRAICRRSERSCVKISRNPEVVRYLNRLSDLFFDLARKYGNGTEITL